MTEDEMKDAIRRAGEMFTGDLLGACQNDEEREILMRLILVAVSRGRARLNLGRVEAVH